ncbi:hypothetical protein [Mycolicibacterium frederiksbergense]|uniref:Uncharacterized protein n=1 Tax=Mycolicibacterium frederiksbergense TaxID=117567 RepID=A0A6H0S1V2_9MYCO|nr:hypothetical protein [Mycolicibacterium frederiksbergense]QIV81552.1 hypothetical protein EXE63_12095 [Mycolicibacterium frederiksbergense]
MANKVFRQTLTTGVVLAGAGAIALTPVTVTPQIRAVADTPRVVSTDVMPAGLFQDLQLIGNGARAAVEQSIDGLVRKVPDIWWTVEEQWPDADLTHWNYAMVANMVFAPITPLLIGPLNDAVAEAVARNFPVLGDQIRQVPELIEYAFIRLVGPLLSAIGGAGQAHSEIFYSMTTWRIEPFIEAIVKAPFHVIDGLLFGGYGDLGPILPGTEGQYIPAPGLFTPWGQPPRVRDIKTPNDIVTTTAPDANASLVSLSTGRDESAIGTDTAVTETTTDTVDENPVDTAVEPAVETVTPDTETVVETPEPAETVTPVAADTEGTDTEADVVSDQTETTKPAKPAKKDPAAGIRQGIKDFRDNVGRTVKKLTGGGSSSRSDSQSGSDKSESTKSEPAGPKNSE